MVQELPLPKVVRLGHAAFLPMSPPIPIMTRKRDGEDNNSSQVGNCDLDFNSNWDDV